MSQPFSPFYVYDDAKVTMSAPTSLPMKVYARGVKGGEAATKDGRRQWSWTYRNEEIVKPESGAVSPLDYAPLIVATTFKDYGAVGAAYDSRARPKAKVTEPIKKLADQLTLNSQAPREQAKVTL